MSERERERERESVCVCVRARARAQGYGIIRMCTRLWRKHVQYLRHTHFFRDDLARSDVCKQP